MMSPKQAERYVNGLKIFPKEKWQAFIDNALNGGVTSAHRPIAAMMIALGTEPQDIDALTKMLQAKDPTQQDKLDAFEELKRKRERGELNP